MKKLLAVALMTVLTLTVFTGCATDPVYEDFSNFNVQMEEIAADYENIASASAEMGNYEDDAALAEGINTNILPLVYGSLEKLDKIAPATPEVQELKAKYVKVMEAYKTGFETIVEACETQDEEMFISGAESLDMGIEYLNEYNTALEEFAAQFGDEVES